MFLRLLLCATLMLATAPASTQPAPSKSYPPASDGSAAASAGLSARKDWIIRHNACGREFEFETLFAAELGGRFDNQGEGFINMLGAKIAFLLAHPREACFAPRPATMGDASRPRCLLAPATGTPSQNDIALNRACLVQQINSGVLALRKDSVLGTTGLFCLTHPPFVSSGEFDVEVRELVRVLYMGGPNGAKVLSAEAIDHMYREMLATRGAPSNDSYSTIVNCGAPARDELGTPEDAADSHSFLSDLGHALGDLFDWLKSSFVKYAIAGIVTAASGGSLGAAAFTLIAVTDAVDPSLIDVRIPETENHRLNIETSRYLVNADIIARLEAENHGGDKEIKADQADVRKWLLQRLQDIAIHDFREFNARPYTRYSLNAVLNLYDFAAVHGDEALKTAAWIVLDLSEAKFAATSNRGRRTSPFRRRAEQDGFDPDFPDPKNLYNIVQGADNELLRAMLLSNQTQLLPETSDPHYPTPAMTAPEDARARLVTVATSGYTLPTPVLAAAADHPTLEQTFVHAGIEHAVQSPAYTITAGGVRTEATASVMGISSGNDYGIAMPTTIMPTIAGLTLDEIFRFDGTGVDEGDAAIGHDRTANTCVAANFACGITPWMSVKFKDCQKTFGPEGNQTAFVNSSGCMKEAKPAFWLAARMVDCDGSFCPAGRRWGVMDVMDAPSEDAAVFEAYVMSRQPALASIKPDGRGMASYVTAAGRHIDFTLSYMLPTVTGVDGVAVKSPVTAGGLVEADGKGHATIKGATKSIVMDFTDWANPKRTEAQPAPQPSPSGVK